jgi:hypothetical protein
MAFDHERWGGQAMGGYRWSAESWVSTSTARRERLCTSVITALILSFSTPFYWSLKDDCDNQNGLLGGVEVLHLRAEAMSSQVSFSPILRTLYDILSGNFPHHPC